MCTFAFAVGLVGCGIGALETATELPTTPRHPDGVVLEPPPAMPSAVDRAQASGVVALRSPLSDKDVEDVVRAYVRAFEREDIDALKLLLAQEAAPIGRAGGRQQLLDLWSTKMKSFEYQKLAGSEVLRVAQLEKYPYETLVASAGQGTPQPPDGMRAGDLYVRVPVETPRIGSEQLFGDVLVFVLRREDGRLKIAGQADEN